jgi:N-glycosidase YbiA
MTFPVDNRLSILVEIKAVSEQNNSENVVYFYSTQGEYGCFSNFSAHGFELDGKYWKTSEHYFQAQKFVPHKEHVEAVRLAKTPKQAAEIGRDRKRPLRRDWESVKEDIMRRALIAKFKAHDDIREILLNTGEAKIVENAPGDYYWGIGKNGSGKNRLGILLMEVREILREG